MILNKEGFTKLVNSMPDDTQFRLKERWVKVDGKLAQLAIFETDYELGSVVYHSFKE